MSPQESKETLEQNRLILQSIKDFDVQIKENRNNIDSMHQKVDSLAKDLDDLVTLYEIVSEQMNPFVGLSKVTKKRLDNLENISNRVDELFQRLDTMENSEVLSVQPQNQPTVQQTPSNPDIDNVDLEKIIELSFNEMFLDSQIDTVIDRYIENLNTGM